MISSVNTTMVIRTARLKNGDLYELILSTGLASFLITVYEPGKDRAQVLRTYEYDTSKPEQTKYVRRQAMEDFNTTIKED